MLDVALILIIASGVFALVASIFALGIGGKLIPGYAFRAKGEQARKSELFVLRSVSLLIYSVAILLSTYGIVVYFYSAEQFTATVWIAVIVATVLVIGFWVWFFISGKIKEAAQKAKQLSEE